MGRAILVCICCVLGAVACSIVYLATTESYNRLKKSPPMDGKIVAVRKSKGKVYYKFTDKKGRWRGPYFEKVSAKQMEALPVGTRVKVLQSSTNTQLEVVTKAPSFLWVLSALLLLFLGGYAIVRVKRIKKKFQQHAGDLEETVLLALRISRSHMLMGGLVFVLMGGFIGIVPIFASGKMWEKIFLWVLALLAAGMSIWFFRKFADLLHPERSRIMMVLSQQPERIVWFYLYHAESELPGATHSTVMLCLDDGQKYPISLGQLGVQQFINAVAQRAPHATYGYDHALDKAFKSNPESLRNVPTA